jgi:EAL domain-containing protein (putative c-di-GMP-specific phosphodiesterase class I)
LIDLSTGRITGFEALVRWPHPERGMISPAEFIPIAEETGLINGLGGLMLRRACMDAAQWPDDVRVAVNLSPLQFRVGNLLSVVMDALKQSGLPARRLELEITETLLLEKSSQVLATLHALRVLGVRISMDDFGTGYSSLSYLRSFPFDKIKIDQSFVRDLGANREGQAIVRAIISLGVGLGITITAEGVEPKPNCAACAPRAATRDRGSCSAAPGPMSRSSGC